MRSRMIRILNCRLPLYLEKECATRNKTTQSRLYARCSKTPLTPPTFPTTFLQIRLLPGIRSNTQNLFNKRLYLDLLGLEQHVEEGAEEAHHREGASNERAHRGEELVEALTLAHNRHRHGRQVVGEASLGNLAVLVLYERIQKCTKWGVLLS